MLPSIRGPIDVSLKGEVGAHTHIPPGASSLSSMPRNMTLVLLYTTFCCVASLSRQLDGRHDWLKSAASGISWPPRSREVRKIANAPGAVPGNGRLQYDVGLTLTISKCLSLFAEGKGTYTLGYRKVIKKLSRQPDIGHGTGHRLNETKGRTQPYCQ